MTEQCPTLEQLEQFVLGKLSELELAPVATHTETCATCLLALTTLDEKQDELLARLRRKGRSPASVEPPDTTISEIVPAHNPVPDDTTIAEESERMQQLLGRLEHLTERDLVPPNRNWMRWARIVFGPSNLDERVQLGPYRLERVLGVGGMGIVFAAVDDQLQRSVAIKVMRPERLPDDKARRRFLREARAIAAIQHDHIVPVFQVGEEQHVPYFVMPLLRGCSLEDWLRERPRAEIVELLEIGVQIADGIAGAHAHGLIHRDIKPSNIWLEQVEGRKQVEGSELSVEGQVVAAHPQPSTINAQASLKLLDFGLARGAVSVGEELSESGLIIGTPAYMSPEQASGGEINGRSDLFSLGCVLYRLTTGELPFSGQTVTQQLTSLITNSVRPIHELNDDLPDEIEQLIHQLLERDPQQRPLTAIEVRDRLRVIQEVVGSHETGNFRSQKQRRHGDRSRSLIRRTIGASVAMLVLGLGILFSLSSRERPAQTDNLNASDNSNVSDKLPRLSIAELLPLIQLEVEWYDRVSKLPAIVRTSEVKAELQRRNPAIGDSLTFQVVADRVRGLTIDATALRDIAPLVVLRELQTLRILNSKTSQTLDLADLRPLSGLPLKELFLEYCPKISSFEPLNEMPLTHFSVYGSPLPNAAWFARQKEIETLNLGGRSIPIDLTIFKHLPLVGLELNETPVTDLAPLAHHRLEMLRIAFTQVSDLSPIVGMPLVRMDFRATPITDLKPLKKLKHLTFLMLNLNSREQVAVLKSLKTLQQCNQLPVSDIEDLMIGPAPSSRMLKPVAASEPIEPWLQRVEQLPLQSLLGEVRSELCRRNPGLEQTLQLEVHGGEILGANFGDGPVADIGPLAALKNLQRLRIGYRKPGLPPRELTDLRPLIELQSLNFVELEFCPELRDLSPLIDKPLQVLSLYATTLPELNWIAGSNIRSLNLGGRDSPPDLNFLKRSQLELLEMNESPVSDISPLADLRLQKLSIAATNVTDLKPLQRMPLMILDVQSPHILDLSPLTSIRTLRHLRCKIHDQQQLALIQSMNWLDTVNQHPLNGLSKTFMDLPRETPPAVLATAELLAKQNQSNEAVHQLAQKVHDELIELNPGYDANLNYNARDGRIVTWEIDSTVLENILPLAQLPDLETIYFWSLQQRARDLADLSPLRGLKLKQVTLLRFHKLKDFSALADMPIEILGLYGTPLPDTQWLSKLKLKELRIGGRADAVDLSFVKQMPLTKLGLQETPFADLRPLSGLKLEELIITNTNVRDLSPLSDMPLKYLSCEACPLEDFKQILAFKRLQRIDCTVRTFAEIKVLRAMPELTEINHRDASETLK